MSRVTLVHLARRANAPAALLDFVKSYRQLDAGIAHELLVICKGYDGTDEVRAAFEDVGSPVRFFPVSDAGFDVGAYFASAQAVTTELVCFLNSHARIRAPRWLTMLVDAIDGPGVGAAGATASCESTSQHLALGLRSQWRALVHEPSRIRESIGEMATSLRLYPWWPNPHLRTNGFLMRTAVFKRLRLQRDDRQSALVFESGRESMTRQLARQGLGVVVVGADGRTFDAEHWSASGTFRCGEQENLLVHDNQTRRYQDAGPDERRYLGRLAWGARYQPGGAVRAR
jgi:hypothetical protein